MHIHAVHSLELFSATLTRLQKYVLNSKKSLIYIFEPYRLLKTQCTCNMCSGEIYLNGYRSLPLIPAEQLSVTAKSETINDNAQHSRKNVS